MVDKIVLQNSNTWPPLVIEYIENTLFYTWKYTICAKNIKYIKVSNVVDNILLIFSLNVVVTI